MLSELLTKLGKTEKIVCSECGKETTINVGRVCIYEDDKGKFLCTGAKCECGHMLNSERLKNADVLGTNY